MTTNGLVSINVEIMTPNGLATRAIKFKPFTMIPVGILRATRKTPSEQVWAILEWACDAKTLEIIDQMPSGSGNVDKLIVEMQKASQVDLGESSGSSTTSSTSKSTATRSRRTSSTKV